MSFQVLLKAVPSFLNSFHRLVVSVMHEGRQKGDRGIVSFPLFALYVHTVILCTLGEEMQTRSKVIKTWLWH